MPGERAYLDWNASAPLRPEGRQALLDALDRFGNPSSPHREGREARALLESSREEVAGFLGCESSEVVFTSGGTEANNLALRSLASTAQTRSWASTRLEHRSVLRPLEALSRGGWRACWLEAGEDGRAEAAGLDRGVGFGVVQAANQETGAIQPLEDFRQMFEGLGVPWHCDAVQAWGRIQLRVAVVGCATASLSAHKLGGPKGVGALYVRRGTPMDPILLGGPQERERRAGTENPAGIASLAAVCRAAATDWEGDARWTASLRDRAVSGAREIFPLVWENGPKAPHLRLPNTASLSFPGLEAEVLVQALDLEGVAVSAGSACASGALEPSHVLRAMGLPDWRVKSAIRVSLGPATAAQDIDRFLAALGRVVGRLRA